MEKELLHLFNTANSAANAAAAPGATSADESRCIDSLKSLKSFPVNINILVETKVGRRLGSLKKHPRKKIQAFVVDLIAYWKKIITEESNRNKKSKRPNPAVMVEEDSKPVVIAKRAKLEQPTETSDSVLTHENHSLSVETTGQPKLIDLKYVFKCNDTARENVRKHLWEGLSKVYGEGSDESVREEVKARDSVGVVVSVESALFGKWGSCTGPNRARYRSLIFNIKDHKNPDFRRKVLLGVIKAESIPSLTTEEMASDQRKLENQLIKDKALFECELGGTEEATTDQFRCSRCGERKCRYHQVQTRSADEPMTTYVKCVNCYKRWKFC